MYQRVSARGRRKTAQEAHRAQGAKCLEKEREESQDVDEIIIIDDPVLQTINVRPSASRYFIFRGGRARVRAQEESPDSRSRLYFKRNDFTAGL